MAIIKNLKSKNKAKKVVRKTTAQAATVSVSPESPSFTEMLFRQRLARIDGHQANRYAKLTGEARSIARDGIIRHLRACDRLEVPGDHNALREIIDDALNGRRVYAEAVR
jgi:hypothetical protein